MTVRDDSHLWASSQAAEERFARFALLTLMWDRISKPPLSPLHQRVIELQYMPAVDAPPRRAIWHSPTVWCDDERAHRAGRCKPRTEIATERRMRSVPLSEIESRPLDGFGTTVGLTRFNEEAVAIAEAPPAAPEDLEPRMLVESRETVRRSYESIAAELGVSPRQVKRCVSAVHAHLATSAFAELLEDDAA